MPKTLVEERSLNPALLALKPRQVLISARPNHMAKEDPKPSNLNPEQKGLLLRSIAQYLDRSGFSKCFKKLLSEAEIEKKELNSTVPDLEEFYCEFLKKRLGEAEDSKTKEENVSGDQETKDKKDKKKKKKEADANEGVESLKKEKKVDGAKEEKVKEVDVVIEDGVKEKKKKKKVDVAEEEKVKEEDVEVEDGVKEKKKKKKKSKSVEGESLGGGDDDKEKVSKKRKRSEPEETKEQSEDGDNDEESKRRKKEESAVDVQETPVKQNGNVEKSETKSGKGLSSSKEPKKPFQRVKVEEVVFTDERLKDNSYWAKDGADIGYGAKAQEVLGQVRGRGFRHEKTKKKRGSYRGGEIDLQSHSVKFDYSDEE